MATRTWPALVSLGPVSPARRASAVHISVRQCGLIAQQLGGGMRWFHHGEGWRCERFPTTHGDIRRPAKRMARLSCCDEVMAIASAAAALNAPRLTLDSDQPPISRAATKVVSTADGTASCRATLPTRVAGSSPSTMCSCNLWAPRDTTSSTCRHLVGKTACGNESKRRRRRRRRRPSI
jgi:hypothetical protein